MKRHVLLGAASVLLAGTAVAQNGTDTCTTPTAVGEGTFSFDTTTMVGSGEMTCLSGYAMNQDMFWVYTATISGDISFDTIGSSFDTQLAVFSGTDCSALCVDDNDDIDFANGNLQSQVNVLGVTAGDMFVIQVGGFDIESGPGVLNIGPYVDPCAGIVDDAFEDNDDCLTATPITPGSYTGLVVIDPDADYFSINVGPGEVLTLTETFDSNDADYNAWDSCGGTQIVFTSLTGFTYTNTSGAAQDVIIEALQWDGADLLCSDYAFDITVTPDPCMSAVDDMFEDNDDCLTATPITAGSYSGLAVIYPDADFFSINVPAGDILTLTETFDSNDTDYNVYDACGGTQVVFVALTGFTYQNTSGVAQDVIIEAHQWDGAASLCSDYAFDVSVDPDPCATFMDDAFEDNDDCFSATPIMDGTITNLGITNLDKDHYSFCVADGATITMDILFIDAITDLDLFLWADGDVNCGTGDAFTTELALGFSTDDNESITYTNLTGADQNVIAEVNVFAGGSSNCTNYDLILSGSGCGPTSDGTPFCDPMDPNSSGSSTTLIGTLGSGVESGLRLEAFSGVAGEFGYFLIGTAPNDPGIAISGGRLCLAVTGGNQFGRYNFGTTTNSIGLFDAAGNFQNLVGTATSNGGYGYDVATANPMSGTIMSGDSWHFQLWHRDTPAGPGSSNFSNGLTVMFP